MAISRVLFRYFATLVITSLIGSACLLPVDARARIIAVIVLRSTAHARTAAEAASKALAARLAQEPGWDAIVVHPHGRTPADAAAAAGAEIYVVGQYFQGSPARIVGAAYRVATDERLGDFSTTLQGVATIPQTVSFAQITGSATTSAPSALTAQQQPSLAHPATISIPSGDLISVAILGDIGSRISQEGDTFAVETVEDYYYKGHLILPKGSPGYGVITHLKRAGSFHAGGELNFTVKRLVTPSKSDLLVETNGATADADKVTEHNGNAFGQYLLWGIGMFAKRGNDILIKKGTTFHVSTLQNEDVPIAADNAQPAVLDPAYTIANPQGYIQQQPTGEAPSAAATVAPAAEASYNTLASRSPKPGSVFAAPQNWTKQAWSPSSVDFEPVGYWMSPDRSQTMAVITQPIPDGMSANQFVQLTVRSLQSSVGIDNVHVFKSDRICNGDSVGWFIQSSVTVGVTPMIAEQTIGVADSQAYIATYRRPSGQVEDQTAHASLYSLCPSAA